MKTAKYLLTTILIVLICFTALINITVEDSNRSAICLKTYKVIGNLESYSIPSEEPEPETESDENQPVPEQESIDSFETFQPESENTEIIEWLDGKELYISYIAQIVNEYYPDVDPYIVQAIMETESRYVPTAYSSAGAIGLMQIMPQYHTWRIEKYGLSDLWDPYTNIICGIDLLNDWYQKYGDWSTTLYGYSRVDWYADHILHLANTLREDGHFG